MRNNAGVCEPEGRVSEKRDGGRLREMENIPNLSTGCGIAVGRAGRGGSFTSVSVLTSITTFCESEDTHTMQTRTHLSDR